jgi:hypothetical protein
MQATAMLIIASLLELLHQKHDPIIPISWDGAVLPHMHLHETLMCEAFNLSSYIPQEHDDEYLWQMHERWPCTSPQHPANLQLHPPNTALQYGCLLTIQLILIRSILQ